MAVKRSEMTEELDFVLTLGSGGSGRGRKVVKPCHKNTMLKNVQNLQNTKRPPVILSCNIHVDTTETSFSQLLVFDLAVDGFFKAHSGGRICLQAEKMTQLFKPSAFILSIMIIQENCFSQIPSLEKKNKKKI